MFKRPTWGAFSDWCQAWCQCCHGGPPPPPWCQILQCNVWPGASPGRSPRDQRSWRNRRRGIPEERWPGSEGQRLPLGVWRKCHLDIFPQVLGYEPLCCDQLPHLLLAFAHHLMLAWKVCLVFCFDKTSKILTCGWQWPTCAELLQQSKYSTLFASYMYCFTWWERIADWYTRTRSGSSPLW